MKKLLFPLILLTSLANAHAQFISKQKTYEINDGDKAFWEKIYRFPITLDTAKYYNGDIIYTKTLEGESMTFRKYHGGGKLHVEGKNIKFRPKNNKTIPFSGNWIVYHYNLKKKTELSFERGRKIELKKYNESGELIKEKKPNQKFTYGFQVGVERSVLGIQSQGDTVLTESASNGFNLGFLVQYQLSQKLGIRTLFSQSFHVYALQFDSNGEPETLNADLIFLRLPVTTMYRVTDNIALLTGLSANLRIEGDEIGNASLKTKATDLNFDTGILYEFKFKSFIIAPELRYSPQLTDWIKTSTAPYSKNVQQLKRSDFSISVILKSIPNDG